MLVGAGLAPCEPGIADGPRILPAAAAYAAPRYAAPMTQPRDPAERARLARRVVELRLEHRDLDTAIGRLQADIEADELALKRLKKRKLLLKDQILWIENALIPDEPA